MAPPRVDVKIEELVVRLCQNECWSYQKVADHVNISRGTVCKILKRQENPKELKTGGKPRCTNIRYTIL